MIRICTFLALLFVAPAAPQTSPTPKAFWPCNNQKHRVFDSNGQTNRYTADLFGGAWDEVAAASMAAADHHLHIACETDCPPPGCVKVITWTYDKITYINGPGGASGNEFTFSITNFVVKGHCTGC